MAVASRDDSLWKPYLSSMNKVILRLFIKTPEEILRGLTYLFSPRRPIAKGLGIFLGLVFSFGIPYLIVSLLYNLLFK